MMVERAPFVYDGREPCAALAQDHTNGARDTHIVSSSEKSRYGELCVNEAFLNLDKMYISLSARTYLL